MNKSCKRSHFFWSLSYNLREPSVLNGKTCFFFVSDVPSNHSHPRRRKRRRAKASRWWTAMPLPGPADSQISGLDFEGQVQCRARRVGSGMGILVGGTPIAGGFAREKPNRKWMITRGTRRVPPIKGTPHLIKKYENWDGSTLVFCRSISGMCLTWFGYFGQKNPKYILPVIIHFRILK